MPSYIKAAPTARYVTQELCFLPFFSSQLRGDPDNIFLMAMRREPDRRYSSVEQFAEDIRRKLNGLSVIAHEDTLVFCDGKFIIRNKAGVPTAI